MPIQDNKYFPGILNAVGAIQQESQRLKQRAETIDLKNQELTRQENVGRFNNVLKYLQSVVKEEDYSDVTREEAGTKMLDLITNPENIGLVSNFRPNMDIERYGLSDLATKMFPEVTGSTFKREGKTAVENAATSRYRALSPAADRDNGKFFFYNNEKRAKADYLRHLDQMESDVDSLIRTGYFDKYTKKGVGKEHAADFKNTIQDLKKAINSGTWTDQQEEIYRELAPFETQMFEGQGASQNFNNVLNEATTTLEEIRKSLQ